MSNSLLDYFEQASEEIDPENDIFSDSNNELKDIVANSEETYEEDEADNQPVRYNEYTSNDEDTDDEDNYDVYDDEQKQGISIAKMVAITLYAVIFLFAFVGALTLFLPNVRLELFATFFS